MATYNAPLKDIRFVLYELLDAGRLARLPGHEQAAPDLIDAVLEQAAKLCEDVLFPLNQSGDEEGCRFDNGVVSTPQGFKPAYDAFIGGGWTSLACDPRDGGQGLPELVNLVVMELVCSSNLSFATYPGLSYCVYKGLHTHGSDEIKRTCLPKLAAGRWSGTMCLTEPHCGTDLGLIRTTAEAQGDATYKVTGTKIFITAGEHDLSENIVHLVLARLPGAPSGIKGLSLFLVPKFLVAADGSLGERNAVSCGAIEAKMGIRASATCVLNFDRATGYLVGEEHRGLTFMFTVMNLARLAVGIQGLGLAEVSYQNARDYARERLQGRALREAQRPDRPADPIIVHADVRNMLLTMKAFTEGARALAYWIGLNVDVAAKHADAEARQEADELVQLMTPVVKALLTDCGFEVTNLGLQVYGGHGYIREHGMEQLVRDARIGQLYEGTNGIQALDLVGRKLSSHYGRLLRRFFHPVDRFIEDHKDDERLKDFVPPLATAFAKLQQVTAWIAERGVTNPEEGAAAARDYLSVFGLVATAFLWARTAEVAVAKLDEGGDADFYRAKIATARYFMARLLPRTSSLLLAIMAGSKPVMALDAEAF